MGSCNSHVMIEVKMRSMLVCVKVPQLRRIQESSIWKRRKGNKGNRGNKARKEMKVENRMPLMVKNW